MAAGSVGATERLTIQVTPSVAFAPANLIVRAIVQQNKDNRAIEIIADSGSFYRSSEIQLDGEDAPRTTRLEFRSLPSGNYQVRAVLKGVDGHLLAMQQTHVDVVSSNPE